MTQRFSTPKVGWTLVGLLLLTAVARGDPPALHRVIDRQIAARAGGALAERSSDAEFLRRVSLDLGGCIPSSKETREFLKDEDPQKRVKLIDRLLASDAYPRRMRQAMTVMLLERRPGGAITDAQWDAYLEKRFAKNVAWNEMVRELIASDGREEETRPAIRFFADGGRNDPHQMTQDVARLFLGMNVECARCHDHPNVTDYLQSDYFGLYSYLNQSKVQNDKARKLPVLAEGVAAAKTEFQSVFTPLEKQTTGPRLPGGKEIAIPAFAKGEEFEKPAEKGSPGIPKFRPRLLLAGDLTAPDNERFALNAVNRFWLMMMGRGLVHPPDLMHSGNPPSHPDLLQALAKGFVASRFDVKHLLREIALSEAYQRSSRLPDKTTAGEITPASYRVAALRNLSAEQLAHSILRATGNLDRVRAAKAPEKSSFTYKDYVNARIGPPDNLPDVMTLFAATFGRPPGEADDDFQPSVSQSLFLLNDPLISRWLEPRDGNLIDRLGKIKDANLVADELFTSLFARMPDDAERAIVARRLEQKGDRHKALARLTRALLTTHEFRLQH